MKWMTTTSVLKKKIELCISLTDGLKFYETDVSHLFVDVGTQENTKKIHIYVSI